MTKTLPLLMGLLVSMGLLSPIAGWAGISLVVEELVKVAPVSEGAFTSIASNPLVTDCGEGKKCCLMLTELKVIGGKPLPAGTPNQTNWLRCKANEDGSCPKVNECSKSWKESLVSDLKAECGKTTAEECGSCVKNFFDPQKAKGDKRWAESTASADLRRLKGEELCKKISEDQDASGEKLFEDSKYNFTQCLKSQETGKYARSWFTSTGSYILFNGQAEAESTWHQEWQRKQVDGEDGDVPADGTAAPDYSNGPVTTCLAGNLAKCGQSKSCLAKATEESKARRVKYLEAVESAVAKAKGAASEAECTDIAKGLAEYGSVGAESPGRSFQAACWDWFKNQPAKRK